MQHKAKLTEGSVEKTLINLTGPMLIGMIGMVAFNLIDTMFVGWLGTDELAAMSFTLPVVYLQGSISMGLGVGAAAVISVAIGRQQHDQVKRLTTDSLLLSVTIVTIAVIIGILTINPVFGLLGAKGHQLKLINDYMFILYMGIPFVVIPMVGNNAIRAAGNTFIPSMVMLTGIVINLILDPILIFGWGPVPRMTLKGAALATVIARAGTLIMSLAFLHFKFNMLTSKRPTLAMTMDSWKRILKIAVPAAVTQLIIPIGMAIIIRMVAGFGKTAVAAVGVGTRIEMLALSPIMALGSIMIPFTGQNRGAGLINRVKRGIRFGQLTSLALGLITFLTFYSSGALIAKVFNQDPQVIKLVVSYLLIVSLGYGFQGMLMINASVFNAINRPLQSTFVNLLRMFAFYIPVGLVASNWWGVKGIFFAAALSAFLSGSISFVWLRNSVKKMK